MDEKVLREDRMVQEASERLKKLEAREQFIIERLKHTQINEAKAKQMLVEAIVATSQGKKNRLR